MFFRYGNYQHPDDEVLLQSFEQIPIRSNRGGRRESLYRMRVAGDIIADGQAAISARITELVVAYSEDYKDAALYQDDGTITRHALLNNVAQNISGVQITHRSWPRGDPAEYATYRHFSIGFQARYTELDSNLVEYREGLSKFGTGGPSVNVVTMLSGPPRFRQLANQTPIQLIQSGRATGYFDYPFAYIPGPIYPDLEHQDRREITYISPQFNGRGYTDYTVSWRYVMTSPVNVNPVPNVA